MNCVFANGKRKVERYKRAFRFLMTAHPSLKPAKPYQLQPNPGSWWFYGYSSYIRFRFFIRSYDLYFFWKYGSFLHPTHFLTFLMNGWSWNRGESIPYVSLIKEVLMSTGPHLFCRLERRNELSFYQIKTSNLSCSWRKAEISLGGDLQSQTCCDCLSNLFCVRNMFGFLDEWSRLGKKAPFFIPLGLFFFPSSYSMHTNNCAVQSPKTLPHSYQ